MVKVLVPSGALGLNYDKKALQRGILAKPDIIAIDGGSTDSGPSYLGRGVSKYARSSTKIEWAGLMEARAEANCPLVIGTAGTCGTDSAVDWMLDITREIAAEQGRPVKIAVLRSSQDPDFIAQSYHDARVMPLANAPEIDADTIHDCTNIVALAGVEQITKALETGADIVIAGRTTDTAIIAALPINQELNAGAAWHGAKIGECGALCATNPQSGVILIDFDADGFTVTPLADGAKATPHTVSAHMLYENSDPFILYEPGGHLDVTGSKYAALDETSVRVTGSKWVPSERYTVKLEGARVSGYQTVVMALLRDAHYVTHAQQWADDIIAKCSEKARDRLGLTDAGFSIQIRLIGQNASFGELETNAAEPKEIGAIGIVTAKTEALSSEIGKLLNPYLLHHPLTVEEEVPTFAFLFSPAEMPRGATYEFVLNHTLTLDDPMDAFQLEVHKIG
ncbi:MAG: acyclic terpene utilization AtuA family protein [Pseudomonadota bacterium]